MLNGKPAKNSSDHPFAKKDPKPTRARLVSLLDPLGRKRYGEVERFLATVNGSTSGLFYYGTNWGWAVRYLLGTKNILCTLHLLPNSFEATIDVDKDVEEALKTAPISADLKRRVARTKATGSLRHVRLPLKNDADFAGFQSLINLRAEALRTKKPAKAKKETAAKKEAPAKKSAAKAPATGGTRKKTAAAVS